MSTTTQLQAPDSTSPPIQSKPNGKAEPLVAREIPLSAIQPSKTNPRKTFGTPADAELVASIKQLGVLVAILVRPLRAGEFELVAGERRFRCAKEAGLASIPAIVREMSDELALEAQIVENLQRADVKPIEEGRGYRQLLEAMKKAHDPKSKPVDGDLERKGTQDLVQTLARKVGKSPRYIYARMKLTELIPELQKDLEEGRIEASHGDELVRLTPKDQKDIRSHGLYFEEREHQMDDERYISEWKQEKGKRAVSIRNLKVIIERDYQLLLEKAKFPVGDDTLEPTACTSCMKNTAVNPLLPAAAKATCTDKECWRQKMRQYVERTAKAMAAKAGAPAKLVQITLSHYESDKSIVTRPGWKTAKAGECKNVVGATQVDVQGNVKHFTFPKLVCTDKKCKVHFGAASRSAAQPVRTYSAPVESVAQRDERLAKQAVEKAGRFALVLAIGDKAKPGAAALRFVLAGLQYGVPDPSDFEGGLAKTIAQDHGWELPKVAGRDDDEGECLWPYGAFEKLLDKHVPAMSEASLARLTAQLWAAHLADYSGNHQLMQLATRCGVDAKKVVAKAESDMKAELAKRQKAAEKFAAAKCDEDAPPKKKSPAKKASKKKGGRK